MQEQNNDENSDVPKDRTVVRIPYLNKMKGMLRRIFLFAEPTIIIQYNYNITHEMSFFGPIINKGIIVDQSLTNIYNATNCYDKDEAEDVECEEVKEETEPKHDEATVCKETSAIMKIDAEQETRKEAKPAPKVNKTKAEEQGTTHKDYSNSPLIPHLTYPQYAQYFIEWLHTNMDNQKNYREKLKAFRAVSEKGYFKGEISYDIFNEEFGYGVSQSWYSRLMNDPNIYFDDELNLAIQSLDLDIFKIKLSINENKNE